MDELQLKLEQLIAPWQNIPGVAVCIVFADRPPVFACSGIASLEFGLPIDTSTRFNLASVSKQFTGFAIRLLEKRGLLQLDDSMLDTLPEFPEWYRGIKVYHLLHHSSGFRDMYNLMAYAGYRRDDVHTRDQLLALTKRQTGLNFTPGERYIYNNTGYILMAEMVHRLTGLTMRQFLDVEVFKPLGMNCTTLCESHKEVIPGASGHYNVNEAGEYTKAHENVAVGGSTNIFTSISDFSLWLGNYVAPKVEPDVMMSLDLKHPFNDGSDSMYACGLEIVERGGRTIWTHSGGAGGYRTEMIYVPAEKIAVGVLSNNGSMDAVTLGGKALGLVIPELAPQGQVFAGLKPAVISETEAQELAGCYRLPGGMLSTVVLEDGKLFIYTPFYPVRLPLVKVSQKHYKIELLNAELEAVYDDEGKIRAFKSRTPIGDMEAEKLPSLKINPDELGEYCGRYWNEELLNTWEVSINDGYLTLFHPHFPEITLYPVLKDEFSSRTENFDKLKFTRNADGQVNGLELSGDRAFNIRFQRMEEIKLRG